MAYDNDIDFTNALIAEMDSIINVVAEKLFIRLRKNIKEIVYSSYKPKVYSRRKDNGGLLSNWERQNNRVIGNQIVAIIEKGHPMDMDLDADNFVHGSHYWYTDDIRNLLADIVTMGLSGPLFGFGPWSVPRDFWTPFIELLDNGTVDRMIESEFKRRGIKYRKI